MADEDNQSLLEEYKTFSMTDSQELVATHRESCPHPHDETEEGERELDETVESLGGPLDAWTKQMKLAAEHGQVIECLEGCSDVLDFIITLSEVVRSVVSILRSEQHDE